ncbi:hypothetical protein WICPIJ_000537 [Wickerhamomyces pijperi]|uniref:Uncharacterized protein n=1 Tax=Wickerhamomyces pijperi TaxID=599730 RepID=A0A9P8TRW6_WICPI|nr:hypothetical protein WICPIJ_000537 [Wickerhamomyces pijperi]
MFSTVYSVDVKPIATKRSPLSDCVMGFVKPKEPVKSKERRQRGSNTTDLITNVTCFKMNSMMAVKAVGSFVDERNDEEV